MKVVFGNYLKSPQNSLLGDKILHRHSSVFSLDLAADSKDFIMM